MRHCSYRQCPGQTRRLARTLRLAPSFAALSRLGGFGNEPHHCHAADLSPDFTDMARQKIKIDQPVQGQQRVDFKWRGVRGPGGRALNLPQHPRIELSVSEGHIEPQLEPISGLAAMAPIT